MSAGVLHRKPLKYGNHSIRIQQEKIEVNEVSDDQSTGLTKAALRIAQPFYSRTDRGSALEVLRVITSP